VMKTRPTAGVMHGRPVAGTSAPAPKAGSIELDPALMAELVAIEMASTPATPPPVAKTPAPKTEGKPITKPLPGLEADPGPTPPPTIKAAKPAAPVPAPAVAAAPAPAPAPAPAAAAAAVTPPPTAEGPIDIDGRRPRRPSSDFSALEKDFFEREADLYKEEKEESFESFDDLDRRR
jgi:hypothetical protein